MNLKERLEAAEADRRREAGLPLLPVDDDTDPAPTIDLRSDAPIIDIRPAERRWADGLPVAESHRQCPQCGGPTLMDMEDAVGGVDHLHCLDCGLLFQVAR